MKNIATRIYQILYTFVILVKKSRKSKSSLLSPITQNFSYFVVLKADSTLLVGSIVLKNKFIFTKGTSYSLALEGNVCENLITDLPKSLNDSYQATISKYYLKVLLKKIYSC